MTDRLLTKEEAAARLSMDVRTLERRLMRAGLIRVYRDGSRFVRIPESEVERIIAERLHFDAA